MYLEIGMTLIKNYHEYIPGPPWRDGDYLCVCPTRDGIVLPSQLGGIHSDISGFPFGGLDIYS